TPPPPTPRPPPPATPAAPRSPPPTTTPWPPASPAPTCSPPRSCSSPWPSPSPQSGSTAPTSAKPGTERLGRAAMAAPPTTPPPGRADGPLMTATHDALRRDLDQLLHTTAGPAAARARWTAFRGQLHRHLAAEQAALWRPARAKLAGDPHGQALLEAMDGEPHLTGPLHAPADAAFPLAAGPGRLHPPLPPLR